MNGDSAGYDYADTEAAQMLRAALQRLRTEQGVSLRALAKQLNYKQATVLSHMASGRIPIPMRKAGEIAQATGMPPSSFIIAVADQRQPASFALTSSLEPGLLSLAPEGFADELGAIAGVPLDALTAEQKEVMRQVATDARPSRRWLSPAEIPAMQLLREVAPSISTEGLSSDQRARIQQALK